MIYIAYVSDKQVDYDEDKEDLLRRCTEEYGIMCIMSELFVIRSCQSKREDEKEQEIPSRP